MTKSVSNRRAAGSRNTFSRKERLSSRKVIDLLFKKGDALTISPVKLLWHETKHPDGSRVKIGIAVPGRLVPLAVNRNRIRRVLREAIRQNKKILGVLHGSDRQFALMFLYQSALLPDFSEINSIISSILNRFISKVGI